MEVENESYVVFKGLQKPLVFKGFKGKFIYWLAGGLLGSFILCIIGSVAFHVSVGIALMVIGSGVTLLIVKKNMRYGLQKKEITEGLIFLDTDVFIDNSTDE